MTVSYCNVFFSPSVSVPVSHVKGTQTESFNQTLGTLENPSCLADTGAVCAAPSSDQVGLGYGPQVVCCNGLACKCGASQEEACYCQ